MIGVYQLFIIDFLVIFGTVIMTIAVIGSFRLPTIYDRMHPSSMSFVMGVIPILIAVLFSGIPALIYRALLIIAFFFLTAPVATHVIAAAEFGIQKLGGISVNDDGNKRLPPEKDNPQV